MEVVKNAKKTQKLSVVLIWISWKPSPSSLLAYSLSLWQGIINHVLVGVGHGLHVFLVLCFFSYVGD